MISPTAPLTTGALRYLDSYPGLKEAQPRVYVKFRPAGVEGSFVALLDTGGHFCILNRLTSALLSDHLADSMGLFTIQTAHGRLVGELYRHTITIIAEVGESLQVESTLFVPPDWEGPCFIGYSGVLDRMCFAVNPRANSFHFGPL
ncbi:MAG: hypothetical protein GY835_09255 [bacterium]|nr:hypothetical protein [bacterium]